MAEPDKVLFVLPLEPRFICAVHKGVLSNPVKSNCIHNICKECVEKTPICPVDKFPFCQSSILETNDALEDEIRSLLCYCKYGVTVGTKGELISDPRGCDHIIKYGNRASHEAKCEFREADFIMIDDETQIGDKIGIAPISLPSVPLLPPPTDAPAMFIPCCNRDDGCFFLAESEQELVSHLDNECSYERLRRLLKASEDRVEFLEKEVQSRDEEISNLRTQLADQSSAAALFAQRTYNNGKELLDEFLKLLEEEIPQGISSVRGHLMESEAFMKSSCAISSLKAKVIRQTGKVKQGLSDIHPLEKLADINPLDKSTREKIADLHPIDRLIAILSSLKKEIVSSVKKDSPPQEENVNIDSAIAASANQDLSSDPIPDPVNNNNPNVTNSQGEIVEELDEEMKKVIALSMASYEEEKKIQAEMESALMLNYHLKEDDAYYVVCVNVPYFAPNALIVKGTAQGVILEGVSSLPQTVDFPNEKTVQLELLRTAPIPPQFQLPLGKFTQRIDMAKPINPSTFVVTSHRGLVILLLEKQL